MVHKHRSAHKATVPKDVSPMRNMSVFKSALSASPSGGFCFGSRLSVPAATAAPTAVVADKWKYNNMVNNNRDHFNNIHFC